MNERTHESMNNDYVISIIIRMFILLIVLSINDLRNISISGSRSSSRSSRRRSSSSEASASSLNEIMYAWKDECMHDCMDA